MKYIIFAGGSGTRLWPLSRKNSPKQFANLAGDKSTLQMAVDRLFGVPKESLYIATNSAYKDIVAKQVPQVLESHILTEPAKRDQAAAVCLTLLRLQKDGYSGPVAILWADHFMDNPEAFVTALKQAEELININPNRFIFLGEKPRFANHNLGWINVGEKEDSGAHTFLGWKYKPEVEECKNMFAGGDWLWNPGYFITDTTFLLSLYKKHAPELLALLEDIFDDPKRLAKEYTTLPAVTFDSGIVEKITPDQAVVLQVDMGWSDPGTLYAYKEAVVGSGQKNMEVGNVVVQESVDCLVFNEEEKKIVTTIGLKGMVVVNTKDAVLVCHKDDVPHIPNLLKKIASDGKEEYL